MTPVRIIVALLVAGSAVVASQQASIVEWELTGPSDGVVTDVIESPAGRLLAATSKGLYQSSDDGAHWTRCGEALGDFVQVLKDGQVLIGPTLTRKLSYVDGTCATRDTVTLPSEYSSQPVFGALVRLNTGRLLASRRMHGLFASDDGGRQWRQAALPPVANPDWIFSFAIVPSGHVVAASNGSVIRSSDSGDTWVRIAPGSAFHRLAVGSSGALFGVGDGLSRSLDEGTTWRKIAFDGQTVWAVIAVGTGLPRSGSGVLFAAVQQPDRVDTAVFRSTDGGVTWTPTGPELTGRVNVFAHTSRGSLIAGTTTGFFRSMDNGVSWQFHGVAPAALRLIAADPEGFVVAGSPGGWVGVDSGLAWVPSLIGSTERDRLPGVEAVYGRALFISRAGRVYAGGQNGLVFSSDRGATWKRAGLERDTFALTELSDGTLLAATYNNGIFRSSDHGETWGEHSMGLTEFTAIGLSTLSSGAVVAATLHQTFMSTDSGRNWVPLTRGFPNQALRPILPKGTANAAVVAVDTTLYELDETHSWKTVRILRSPITSLAWDDAGRLWIGTSKDGVMMARKDGDGWTASYVGPSADTVFGLATSRGYVVATTAAGVVRAALPR